MKILSAVATIFFFAVGATAQTTNDLSDAEIQGQQLAKQLCEIHPTETSTNRGILEIRNSKGKTISIPTSFDVDVAETNWQNEYYMHRVVDTNEVRAWTALIVTHSHNAPNKYQFYKFPFFEKDEIDSISTNLPNEQTMIPFANSDFWIADLGLEFFHWPEQKILKHEMKRGRACTVLESTNPNPSANGYSRVVSWIDNETLGIVHAEAYDSKNKLLKEFDPKSFKKVNGQWELQEMEIRNVQTGSRSRLEFDVKKE